MDKVPFLVFLGGGALLLFLVVHGSRHPLARVVRILWSLPLDEPQCLVMGGVFLCVVGIAGLWP